MTDLQAGMCSTQRLLDSSELPSEGEYSKASEFTIKYGKVEFVNICLRYHPDCKLALNNLNLHIEGREKIGIIGRTDAGKSSILQVLFRLARPESGLILIDGLDYLNLGLNDLRKQISVITQNAFVFTASIRDNLDPFKEHTDIELRDILDEVSLGFLVNEISCLDAVIIGQDLALSAGQKQLICEARAVLRKNKIIMMDEPTSTLITKPTR